MTEESNALFIASCYRIDICLKKFTVFAFTITKSDVDQF